MATSHPRPQEPRPRRILVVAADPAERDRLRAALEAKAWPVVTADGPQTTAQAIQHQPPDLVILRHVHGHDSWSVAVEVACPPDIPILFLAAADERSRTSSLPAAPPQGGETSDFDHLAAQVRDLLAAQPDSGVIRFWRRNFLGKGDGPGPTLPRDPIAGGAEGAFPPAWCGIVRNLARARHQQDLASWLLALSRTNRLELERRRVVLAETRAWAREQVRLGLHRPLGPGYCPTSPDTG